ncbi:MAG TPA: DUF6057 family protein [Planctomycetota bacterium]|nr:DUF6057 family protein [Planctomycetota bacterium]
MFKGLTRTVLAACGIGVAALLVAGCGGRESAVPGDSADGVRTESDLRGADLVDDCARRGRWDLVLETARTLEPAEYSLAVMHDVQRALFHSGRLLDEMFTYPQTVQRDGRFLFSRLAPRIAQTAWKRAEVLFELGHVNLAEMWAHLTLEVTGPRAEPLRLLSDVYVLKGQSQMARTCLNVLIAVDPSQQTWARERLRRLDEAPGLTDDPRLAHVHAMMPVKDYARGPVVIPFREHFLQLLDTNPRNRMALEYLVAFDLWSRHADDVVADLRWWEKTADTRLPRHCQEAVLVFLTNPRYRASPYQYLQSSAESWSERVDATVRTRYQGFKESVRDLLKAPQDEHPALMETLEKTWGGDWYFYDAFGYSAGGKDLAPVDAVTGATE